jgi:hypothetical protein
MNNRVGPARKLPIGQMLFGILIGLALLPRGTSGKDFSVTVVDGLGRPVEGVLVDVHWLRKDPDREVRKADLLKVTSDAHGIAKGTYDEKTIPVGEEPWVEISKDGYEKYTSSKLSTEYVIKRTFAIDDLSRIASLPTDRMTSELREFLAGDLEGSLEKSFFDREDQFRPALRALISDLKIQSTVFEILAFIGVPEDLSLIVSHRPGAANKLFSDRWAYFVACALAQPRNEDDWLFLKSCARGEYDDDWAIFGGVQALKLIAAPRSLEILKTIRDSNTKPSARIQNAIKYIESKPDPLEDSDLQALAKRLAEIIKISRWKGNSEPHFNGKKDKAWIDCVFIAGRDELTYTATFHKEKHKWKFRGVRETMQSLLAKAE